MPRTRFVILSLLVAASLAAPSARAADPDIDALQKAFQAPPDDARMMVRWWWFGPAVTREGIDRELRAMKAGGIGGVEIQPTYPLAVDGPDIKNLKFMSPEFLDMLGYAATRCKELGLRMDLTLGSGWPYGGPEITLDESASALEVATAHVAAGQATAQPAQLRAGRRVIAAFVGPTGVAGVIPSFGRGRGGARGAPAAEPALPATEPGETPDTAAEVAPPARSIAGRGPARGPSTMDLRSVKEIPVENGIAQVPANFAGGDVIFFIQGHPGASATAQVMQVKRPALGAEGNVLDHLSASSVDKFIHEVAEPEIKACVAAGYPPHAVFCDSLEVSGENWTPDFFAEFQKRRGYDLKPLLPALIANFGDRTDDIRYDYARTLTELFNDNFNSRFTALAHKYNSLFRVQGYGSPPAGLFSYAYSDLPEGEAGGNGLWRNFRATRYASSASHLMGLPVTSSETFTWLHQAPFRATPLDIKGEVDTHFLDGINQVICHGWPYTGNGASYPGWSFYAGGVFDDKNPWYIAMPDIALYIQRASTMLRQGTPANDIALYLPDSDVWSRAWTGYSSMNAAYTSLNGMVAQIVDHGYNLDAWDDGMLELKGKVDGGALAFAGPQRYSVVVLPNIERMPLATARKLEEFAKNGGLLLAIGRVPSKVPGYQSTADDQKQLAAIMQRLFKETSAPGMLVAAENQLGDALARKLPPDVAIEPAAAAIGAIHRHTDSAEIYFLANTGSEKQSVRVSFRLNPADLHAERWNPLTGTIQPLAVAAKTDAAGPLVLNFAPLESTFIVWTHRTLPPPSRAPAVAAAPIDLSGDWSVSFRAANKTIAMQKLTSWSILDGLQNYSGVATYEKKFTLGKDQLADRWFLSLGEPTARAAAAAGPGGRGAQGYSAPIDPPVYDAAVVYVNDRRAGAIWCPPYELDVAGLLKEGENNLRIEVANTAMNDLVKAGFPNYDNTAVRAAFGNRFDPQGRQLYSQLVPAGLAGPIKLESR